MKRIIYSLLCLFTLQLFLYSCQEDEPHLGEVPTTEDAVFTFKPTAENDNIIEFSSASDAFLKRWDFGNGSRSEGNTVKGTFALKGTYTVTLTVYRAGGSQTSKQTVEIAKTDTRLLDIPIYNRLTGGNARPEGKKWVIDAGTKGHFGVGPPNTNTPDHYSAAPNDKAGAGMYDDKYTFKLSGFTYEWVNNGDVFINNKQQPNFPITTPAPPDFKAEYAVPDALTWNITTDPDGKQFLEISTGGFIGYYTGVSTYEILSLTDTELKLRYADAANSELFWYLTLIPDDFTPPEPPGLTEKKLTGESSKTWILKPAVGAFGVGGSKGSDNYWPNGVDISGDRPCLFNDEFIFKTGGVYQYDSKGDIFGEDYMSSVAGCTDESNLLPDAVTWGSGTHSFTFTPATDTSPAYITVTGTGAFIALPKAHNGGEYGAGPPDTDGSVKYEVLDYEKNGNNETLKLTVDIGGGTFWNFVLINKQ